MMPKSFAISEPINAILKALVEFDYFSSQSEIIRYCLYKGLPELMRLLSFTNQKEAEKLTHLIEKEQALEVIMVPEIAESEPELPPDQVRVGETIYNIIGEA